MNIAVPELRAADLFAGLTAEQMQRVAAIGTLRTYRQGDIILEKGEKSTEVYVVLSGQVEVMASFADESVSSLVVLGAGQSFGEMSLLDAGPRSATIRCASVYARVLEFGRDVLLRFWSETPPIGYQMMMNIARDLAFKLRVSHLTSRA